MPLNNAVHRVRERIRTKFENKVPQYFLNHKNQLEVSPIMKDCQAIIDSAEYTSLDAMYDRLLEINAQMYAQFDGGDLVQTREGFESDLDYMLEIDAIKDRYAAEDPSVQFMSHKQMIEHIRMKLDSKNQEIEDFKTQSSNSNLNSNLNSAVGGEDNAQKNEPQSE